MKKMGSAIYYLNNPDAPTPNEPPRFGAAVILRYKDRILMEHRRDNFSWGLVSGGLHDQETFIDCAIRETLEETGVELEDSALHFMKLFDDPTRVVSFLDGHIHRLVTACYTAELTRKPKLVCGDENLEIRFICLEDLEDYEITVTHQDILEDYLKRQKD